MAAFDFHMGASVHCTDGRCGKLVKLVVDPQSQQITDLIVEKGFLLKQDRVLPVATVERVTPDDIYLTIHSDSLGDYAEYKEVTVEEPIPEAGYRLGVAMNMDGTFSEPRIPTIRKRLREGIAAGKAVLDRHSEVETLDKVIGHVDHVIVDGETDVITHLVMRRGFFGDYRVIPVEMVEEVGDDIFVLLSREELNALPHYEPGNYTGLSAQDQDLSALETEPLSRPQVEGRLDVAAQVSRALAADPRTADSVIEAIYDRGIVTLQGHVTTVESRIVAEQIAKRQSGVHAVHNELIVPRELVF